MLFSLPVVLFVLVLVFASIKILREYERAVVFPAGPLLAGEGPRFVHPDPGRAADGARRPAHHRDGRAVAGPDLARQRLGEGQRGRLLPRRRSAEGDHQRRAFYEATSQLAQTTLRSVLGQHDLDEMLAERDKLNHDIRTILDAQTDAWGIKVANVEIKHVDINEVMVACHRPPGRSRAPAARQGHPCRRRKKQAAVSLVEAARPAGADPRANPAALTCRR
jgi:regulator of protease activity HflC (stomatin/prohibitin superfamily)